LLIEVERGATLTLYDFQNDRGNGFVNLLQNIHVNQKASVVHIISKDNHNSSFLQRCDVDVDSNGQYKCYVLDTGGAFNKQDININLTDDNASCELHGAGVMGDKDHSDWKTTISHMHPNTNSNESFKVLADST
jgi:Fe-S cluster assembly protein SufD